MNTESGGFERGHFRSTLGASVRVVHTRPCETAHASSAMQSFLGKTTSPLGSLPFRIARERCVKRPQGSIQVDHGGLAVFFRSRSPTRTLPRCRAFIAGYLGNHKTRHCRLLWHRSHVRGLLVRLNILDFVGRSGQRWRWRSLFVLALALFGLPRQDRACPSLHLLLLLRTLGPGVPGREDIRVKFRTCRARIRDMIRRHSCFLRHLGQGLVGTGAAWAGPHG